MLARLLSSNVFSPHWGRQMRFIAGPRQCGKTTLVREFLKECGDEAFYYNWDEREVRSRFHRKGDFLTEDRLKMERGGKKRWICYDEIHKMKKWKDILKGHFDAHEKEFQFIITGSARLDLFRRSGDSLAGRYFLFHLLPLNLFEITRRGLKTLDFLPSAPEFVESRMAGRGEKEKKEPFEHLFRFGGFPEPFLKENDRFLRLWHHGYLDRLVREDLRDLTRIGNLENVAALAMLLPERVGSPLSLNSLRGDLSVSHETIRNYLQALRLCYFTFEVPAYSKKINRSLKKEKKVYFHDWSFVPEEGRRFENYVAAELLGWTLFWEDSGLGDFDLRTIRTREGKECDFLILKDNRPWLLLETKLKDQSLAPYLLHFSKAMGGIPVVQVVREHGVLRVGQEENYSVSASRFFSA